LITLNANDVLATAAAVRVFPNPASDFITMKHPFNSFGNVTLFDMQGRNIKELFSGTLSAETPIEVAINDVKSGVYFIKIFEGENTVSKKLIIH
jgi:hypothetical protein